MDISVVGSADIDKWYPLTVTVEPADDDGHGGVDTGDSQEEGTILSMVIAHDTEECREPSKGDEQWEDDEEETVLGQIGESGDKHGKDE